MKERIKGNIKLIIGIIIGMICSGVTVYASYQYIANEVSYHPADQNWKVESVEEALNELYKQYQEKGNGYGVRRRLDAVTSEWERVGESVGLYATAQIGTIPVKNDFDNIYPWSDMISYNYDTDTKQITAYYGEENFTFTPTGNVEVLTKIPEFYYKRYQDDTYEYVYISKEAKEGYTQSEAFSVGRYPISGDSTRVHSRSGVIPAGDTITNFRNYARKLGEEFGQLDYHYFLIQLLYLVEYADYNSQIKLGQGYMSSAYTLMTESGGCDTLGMKSGSVDGTDNSSVIYRGIEDIFGNIWQFVDGINIKDYQAYICYDKNQYEVDKYDGCYQPIGYLNSNVNGQWSSKLGYDATHPLIAFPIQSNGKCNTHITDIYWINPGNRIAIIGGRFFDGLQAGLWNWNFYNISSGKGEGIIARLMKID